MSAEKDITLEEKRVYAATAGRTEAFVACGVGLARVAVSDALVGEFGLVRRGDARDVAAGAGSLVLAADGDVHVAAGAEDEEPSFEATGFGPATAVEVDSEGDQQGAGIVAAGGGRVARLDGGEWTTLCELDGVRAIDGDLIAAESGVHRLDGTHVGLGSARDVASSGLPFAATDDGLYYLGNGWMDAHEGDFRVVASDGERAHAATDGALYERVGAPDEWAAVDLPAGDRVVDVAHAETTYAVTDDGTFLAHDTAEEVWRDRTLGLADARSVAVVDSG
ncbi:hypothetical protein ACFQE8_15090 [Salinirubellus sp. GCM10025818]|uniref:HVO_0234 family beta-propeller protein n=1 Tax=Salinirubellus TaxID=2162630 RepID=UPI0030CF282A